MKKILITGANGFIGKHTVKAFAQDESYKILSAHSATPETELHDFILTADYIIHLAGTNRPTQTFDFYKINTELTERITTLLVRHGRSTPVIFSSSIHAETETDYGKSKAAAEKKLLEYHELTGANIFIFRLPHIFGTWAKPNYNSVIATFCYNIKHNIPITVTNPTTELTLVYVDDLTSIFRKIVYGQNLLGALETTPHYYTILTSYRKTLGEIVEIIRNCKSSTVSTTNDSDSFTRHIYTTYASY